MVLQLQGSLTVNLRSKETCYDFCGEHEVALHEGEALIFLTDLWSFSYLPTKENFDSVTIMTETDFVV